MMTPAPAETIVQTGRELPMPHERRRLEMSTKLMIVGAVSTLCLGVGLAAAETPSAAPQPGRTPMVARGPRHVGQPADAAKRQVEWMAHTLRLSAEQKTAFEKALEQQRSERDALREKLREGGEKLAEALDAARPVPATVGTLMLERRDLERKLEVSGERSHQALRALLTADQQAVFDSLPKPGLPGLGPRRPIGPDRGPRSGGMGPMHGCMGPMKRPHDMPFAPMAPPPFGPEPPEGERP